MSDASNVSSNPRGELRPRIHKLATKQALVGSPMPRERCDDPSAAFEGLGVLPYAPNGSILAHGTGAIWEYVGVLGQFWARRFR